MNNSINLVSTKNEQLERELRLLLFVRVIAVCMLIAIAAGSIIAFVVSTTIPIIKIKQEENSALSNISALHSKLTTYYLTKDRISNINNLFTTRKDFTKALDILTANLDSDINIESLNLEKNVIRLEVSSSSLLSLNKLINNVNSNSKNSKVISKVELSTLSLKADAGLYSLVLTAEAK